MYTKLAAPGSSGLVSLLTELLLLVRHDELLLLELLLVLRDVNVDHVDHELVLLELELVLLLLELI